MAKTVGLTFPKKKYTCPVCGKQFKSEEGLKRHMAEHDAGSDDPGNGDPGSNDTEE